MSESAITITTSWDDGHPLDRRLAELLYKYGLPGTFYVPMETEHGVLSAHDIRELAVEFEIGAHTVHHRQLTELSPEQARWEIVASRRNIEDITGAECLSFCFPSGKFQGTHLPMVRDAGFAAARTVELLSLDPPRSTGGILLMPTTVQVFSHSGPALFRNIARRGAFSNGLRWIRNCRRLDWVSVTRSYLLLAIRQGGIYHLWGHSWEIEEYGQWGRLEEVLRMLSEMRGVAQLRTNLQVCQGASNVPTMNALLL